QPPFEISPFTRSHTRSNRTANPPRWRATISRPNARARKRTPHAQRLVRAHGRAGARLRLRSAPVRGALAVGNDVCRAEAHGTTDHTKSARQGVLRAPRSCA